MNRLVAASAGPTAVAPVSPPPSPGSILMERILTGGLTALMAARMLVAGDDPGRLRLTSGAGPLTLNALTFILLLGWAGWRGCCRRPLTRGPGRLVPAGLLAVGILLFISAAQPDRYQRPGWFLAWDWLALAALCFLTWQLAASAQVFRGLVGVLLATTACLAIQALGQGAATGLGLPSGEIDLLPSPAMPLAGDDEFGLSLAPPLPQRGFRATFDRPETFVGILGLFLPAAIIWGWTGAGSHGRGGLGRLRVVVPLVLAIALGVALWSWLMRSPPRCQQWGPAVEMIERSPWFGIGPGNFSRHAGGGIWGPNSYWLGLAATCGLLAAGMLLAVWIGVVVIGLRQQSAPSERAENAADLRPRWEFYQGGVAGLLLGMILATGDIPAEADASEMLRLGAVAAARAFVWFAVFALLENGAVSVNALRRGLLAGVVLLGLFGAISDTLGSASMQHPLWLAAVLALARPGLKGCSKPLSLPMAWIGLPIAFGLLTANVLQAAAPGTFTSSAVRSARSASRAFPHAHWKTERGQDLDHITFVRDAERFLRGEILSRLSRAIELDPGNSSLKLEKARWNRWRWHYLQELRAAAQARAVAAETLHLAERADQIDSRNLGGKLSQYETLLMFTRPPFTATQAQVASLEKLVAQIAEQSPQREVPLRYRVVLTLLDRRDLKRELVDVWAVALLKLDAEDGGRHGRLTDEQRSSLVKRLKDVIQEPSKELAEILIEG